MLEDPPHTIISRYSSWSHAPLYGYRAEEANGQSIEQDDEEIAKRYELPGAGQPSRMFDDMLDDMLGR